MTCNQCGGVVAVDNLIGRLRVEINHLMAGVGRQLRDRTVLIWVLALFPILILPPLLALLMSFRSLRVPEPGQARDIHRFDVLVVIVAICNIILSVMFWRWLSEISMSSGLSLGLFFKSIGVKPPGALRSI